MPRKKTTFRTKDKARQFVWDQISKKKVACFPFPPHGRIPNFVGAREAAKRLFEIPVFRNARRIKVNPDAPQRYVRELALRMGMTVFVPTPRLRAGFKRFDPATIPQENLREAASLSKGARWGEEVALEDLPQLDAIVAGSVAVTRSGHRCGKGEGYSDLEFGMLLELGHAPVPLATTVHPVQVLDDFPRDAIDLPLSYIVTPYDTIRVRSALKRTKGIHWNRLKVEQLKAMPVLNELYKIKGLRRQLQRQKAKI